MIHWSKTIDFCDLFTPTTRYKTQNKIDESSVNLCVACLFYYKIHLSSVIFISGGEGEGGYTEAYRDIDSIQATIRKSYCSNDILESVTLDAQTSLSLTPLVKTSSCIKLRRSHEYHSKYR